VFSAEENVWITLSMLADQIIVAEAARRAKMSEQSGENWKRQFLDDSARSTRSTTRRWRALRCTAKRPEHSRKSRARVSIRT
jgi:hypothetical protein